MENELVKKLSQFEKQIESAKVDMIVSKNALQIAYDYKDDLYSKMKSADENIAKQQIAYFQEVQRLQDLVSKMKTEIDSFTKKLAEPA